MLPRSPSDARPAPCCAAPDGTVLSHHSAAGLWAIGSADRDIHLLVQGGWTRHRPGVAVHRTNLLEARDIRIREGLPVTSPARTLLDCAGTMSTRALERMFTEAVTLKLVSRADLEDVIARGRGRSGCAALRALLDEESDPAFTRSDAEKRMLALVGKAGLPAPLVNAPLHGFEVDFYWPAHAVVVEIDSYGFHTTRWAYERDRDKDAVLRSHGLAPLRFSSRQVRDAPLLVIAQLAGALGAAVRPTVAGERRSRRGGQTDGGGGAGRGGGSGARIRGRRRGHGPLRLPDRSRPAREQEHDDEADEGEDQAEGEPDALAVALAVGEPGGAGGREQPDEQQVERLGADPGAVAQRASSSHVPR